MRSILKKTTILFLCFTSLNSFSHENSAALPSEGHTEMGGDLVNNGGGLAEIAMRIAFENLDSYLRSCLSSASCQLDARQRDVLHKILLGLPTERLTPNFLQFVSEANNPGFFIIDSEIKVAKTGSLPGTPIYINTDMLYVTDHSGYKTPIETPAMLAILVHELGHHYSTESHDFLDLLGVRVGMFISQQSYVTSSLPWLKGVHISAINASKETIGFPEMTLFLGDRAINLSGTISQASMCAYKLFPGADIENKWPLGTYIYNLHWSHAKQRGGSSELVMQALMSHWCRYDKNFQIDRQEQSLMVRLKVTPKGEGYDVKSVSIRQNNGQFYTPKRN